MTGNRLTQNVRDALREVLDELWLTYGDNVRLQDVYQRAEAALTGTDDVRIEKLSHSLAAAIERAIAAETALEHLRTAIRAKRDVRGDDRCWRDDEALYQMLPEGYEPPARDTAVEIGNCLRFIASCQHPKTEYVSPEREIERLRNELDKLRGRHDRG